MADKKNIRWCLLIVACLALFAYHRRSAKVSKPAFEKANSLEVGNAPTADSPLDELYTTVPVNTRASETKEWQNPTATKPSSTSLNEALSSSAKEANDSEIEIESELDPQEIDLFDFENKQFADADVALPSNLPKPSKQVTDSAHPQSMIQLDRPFDLPEGVQIKTVQHIEYGKALARRGAVFGAKKEFYNALRLVAQAIDVHTHCEQFTTSLYLALVAIEEADDFFYAQAENNGMVDVQAIGSRHDSKILSEDQMSQISAVDAMQAYYNFAQEQLVRCGGKTVVAGEAMYCLGKLFTMKSKNVVEGSALDNAKAIVHHRSALQCDVRNYKSANELAVLLVKSGRFEQAKKLLVYSLKLKRVPAAWENLAFIHRQLGEERLAKIAYSEYQKMLGAPPSTQQIQWVSPEQFAAGSVDPVELRTADASSVPTTTNDKKPNKSIKEILKRLF